MKYYFTVNILFDLNVFIEVARLKHFYRVPDKAICVFLYNKKKSIIAVKLE